MIRTRAVSPTLGLRKRTIEDDDGRADSARHGTTARRMPCRTAYYSNGNDARRRNMRRGEDDVRQAKEKRRHGHGGPPHHA
ncbi:hypothetical protein B0G69_2247 [Paraburkholderia sp. RAU2J]|nr:hypothetical protein B0G69_2247 [Paraburkholderia sp. RAU2J]